MPYEWDAWKRKANLAKHGVDFEAVFEFDWDTAIISFDDREDYGEIREMALGFIGVGLFQLIFTERDDGVVRVISLRKANEKEIRTYVEKTGPMEGGSKK